MTTHMKSLVVKSAITWQRSIRGQYSFGKERQRLRRLKGRTWGILSHDGTIEKRLERILTQFPMCLTALFAYHSTRVVGRSRNHTKDFAGRWFNRHNTADFTFHKTLSQSLQLYINTKRDILAWLCPAVHLTITIMPLYPTTSIANHYLYAFDTAKVLFIAAFNS